MLMPEISEQQHPAPLQFDTRCSRLWDLRPSDLLHNLRAAAERQQTAILEHGLLMDSKMSSDILQRRASRRG